MKKSTFMLALLSSVSLFGATELTHHDITWKFDRDYPVGQFVNGDYYVIGDNVKVVSITNTLNDKSFPIKRGKNGSMINPVVKGNKQGFHVDADKSYVEKLNAALPGGKELSPANPIVLKPNDSLVSSVSWLWRSNTDKEKGAPRQLPRVGVRRAAILTCLDKAPPEGSFRPPYCEGEKKMYNVKDLKLDVLRKLDPPKSAPDLKFLEARTTRPWIDHGIGWYGAFIHPSENMPDYGRDMCHVWEQAMLLLNCDFDKLPGKPKKDKLLINIVQQGIDLAAAAKAGCQWEADGGHCAGRKPVILFTGLLLDDPYMKNVGNWDTKFQDNQQTFYVNEDTVKLSNSSRWKPDKRAKVIPYSKDMIGMPEWGIRHENYPPSDNAFWGATYRDINNSYIPGFALVSIIMDSKKLFNHDAYFDYADRVMSQEDLYNKQYNRPPRFVADMWKAYRGKSSYDKKWDKFLFLK